MPGFLVLETGEAFQGVWHGDSSLEFQRAGEVVFNTSHSGYEEIATDPSYFSQIVVMTAPMQGNYGVSRDVWESHRMWIEGFVCLQLQGGAGREQSWRDQLFEHQIPALSEVDTRALAVRLRSGGTPWGALVSAENSTAAQKIATTLIARQKNKDKDWVHVASRKEKMAFAGLQPKGPKIAVLDFGAKENILRELKKRCSEIIVYPSRTSAEEIRRESPQGLMLTNGPGDPADVQVAVSTVQALLGQLPIFGICMGHQILGLALGAKTYKLKFGHRGSNHPIRDELLKRVYMTSQNHGYAVDAKTLPADVKVTQVNLNDMTVAGFWSAQQNCLGIQYHPESHPGPHDAVGLFDYFVSQMIGTKGGRP